MNTLKNFRYNDERNKGISFRVLVAKCYFRSNNNKKKSILIVIIEKKIMTADHQNIGQSLISIWCISQRFDCILTVFTRKKVRQLTRRRLMKHDATLWLTVFQPLWSVHNFLLCFFGVLLPHGSAAVRLPLLCFLIVGNHASGISIYSVLHIPVDVVIVKSYNDLQSNLSVRTPL